MKRLIFVSTLLISILIYGIFLSQYSLSILPNEIESKNADGFFDYRGATNVHSSLNKGTLPPELIVKEAQEAKLDFLFFTDLNYFEPEAPIQEGYHNRLLVFWGGAYSYLDAHLLYYSFGSNNKMPDGLGNAQMQFAEILSNPQDRENLDFTVLAHPFKGRENWSGPYPAGLNGLEVINLKSVWRQAWNETRASFFWSVFVYPFNSHLSLIRLYLAPNKEIELWDRLNKSVRTIGFVGNESTARVVPIGNNWLRFPSYKTSLEVASNHVLLTSELTGNPADDRKKILRALKDGQFYMSLDILADPKGFAAYVTEADKKKKYPLGAEIKFRENLKLNVRLPEKPNVPFEVVILKDGEAFSGSNSQNTSVSIPGPGAYRVVVRVIPTFPLPDGKKWISWIYTNSFYISGT